MRYLKIRDDLYLKQEEVNVKEEIATPKPTNHVWIYDRSGSMYYTLPGLIEDLVHRVKQLPKNDTITLGWFSTEGMFNFIVKGFRISDNADYVSLETMIRKNNTSLYLTCFSEILTETKTVIEDLKPISERFSLCFFSDGYPVVSNYQKEISNIFSAINHISYEISSVLLVGYGSFYNKELMSMMAEKFGGSLIHASNLNNFAVALTELVERSKDAVGRIYVPLIPNKDEIIFSVNGGINVYKSDPVEGGIWYTPCTKGKNWLFTLTKIKPSSKDYEEITLTESNVKETTSKINHFIKGIYAAAYVLSQRCQNDLAMDVLGILGDRYLLDRLNNAFTVDEYGVAEEDIKNAVTNPNRRFVKGRNTNYKAQDDAPCVLDLLEYLSSRGDVYLLPQFMNYKKVGVPSVFKEGYPKFEPESGVKCKLADLVWNKSQLNLSILSRVPGTIKLKDNYKKFGFKSNIFKTFVWRNYTIIKSGMLNVEKLPIEAVLDTMPAFITPLLLLKEEEVYIDLTKLPIMNRKIAKENTSATSLFKNAIFELKLQAALKFLKYRRNLVVPEVEIPSGFEGFTEEQVTYLMDLGVTKNGYSPPTDKLESTDYYMAKKFEIKIKGFSSLPSIETVLNKEKAGKKLTPSEQLINQQIKFFDSTSKLETIDLQIAQFKKELNEVRYAIQKAKFAVCLAKVWFNEFPSRENCMLDINGYNLTIELGEQKVEY